MSKALFIHMQKIISDFLGLLPRPIALAPYEIANFVVCFIAKQFNLICWTRNSYRHKRIVPGISDIDFTILYSAQIEPSRLHQFLAFYQKLKKIIPILGEINVYQKEMLYLTERWINPYELRRDPGLQTFLTAYPENSFNLFTYLLRMLESDAKYLKLNLKSRLKKWNFHLEETNQNPLNDLQIEELINSISKLKPISYPQEEISDFLFRYILEGTAKAYSYLRNKRSIKLFIILYPHRWLVHANGINDVEISLGAIKFLPEEINLILNQIQWELVGLQTQVFSRLEKGDIESYLELIIKFLRLIKTEEANHHLLVAVEDVSLLLNIIKDRA